MIVSLPWYDFKETQEFHDAFWECFRRFYSEFEEQQLPVSLDRLTVHSECLMSKNLFLTQTCGFDIAYDLPAPLQMITTPIFQTEGAGGGQYSSYLVKRIGSPIQTLTDAIAVGKFVANDCRSFSGYHCVNELAPLPVLWSGSHVRSLEMIEEGLADWAAIDVITWSLMKKYSPYRIANIEIFGRTRSVMAPPLVTALSTNPDTILKIQKTLSRIQDDVLGKDILKKLFIESFNWFPKLEYQMSFLQNPRKPFGRVTSGSGSGESVAASDGEQLAHFLN